ncbi:helix-turn-helix domain-containing protein [Streptomyces sp. NPDC005438]|uniref:winged helix-turn-helix transcriptional regulator n=1 Tax=Streptomyces sp. NPDC005438 TaxID=3156880 RepID=UPI0033B11E54
MGDTAHADCPARGVLDHVTSRWGVAVLGALRDGPLRFHQLRDRVGRVSEKMLSQTLRTLVADGLVLRTVEPTSPPAVSYALTELGEGVSVPLGALSDWLRRHAPAIEEARRRGPHPASPPGPPEPRRR